MTGSRALRAWQIVVLTAAYPLAHKAVSDVFDWASARWGFETYNRATVLAIPVLSLLAAAPALVRRHGLLTAAPSWVVLVVLALSTAAAHRWLMVVNVELIHLPQFALIAVLALSLGFGGPSAFLVAVAAGVVDETYQHLVIYAGRTDTYFDVNDIVLNALGAAWGVALFGEATGAAAQRAAGPLRSRRALAILAPAALAAAWWLDPPELDPLLRIAATGKMYRVISLFEGIAACVLLWALVAALSRIRRLTTIHPAAARHAGAIASIALATLLPGCARAVSEAPAYSFIVTPHVPMPQIPFITTFWCGPPLAEFSDARAAEIAAAGFTIVGPPCEGPIDEQGNLRALDVAARHGLTMWVTDPRFDEQTPMRAGWEPGLDAAVAAYRDHPALGGFFVSDEPSAAEFEGLAKVVARLHAASDLPAYINLLPDYVGGGLGTRTYLEYVERFVTTVRPRILSYDYYPFRVDGDRRTFFDNLAVVREVARRHGVPFMLIVLAMPHGAYRNPSEAEIAWQALHALAFGAQGLSYFAYWTPVGVEYADLLRFRNGLIERGRPTAHYGQAARINRTARRIAAELAGLESIGVVDGRGDVAPPPPLGPMMAIQGGPVTAGLFSDGNASFAALLVNRDYRRPSAVALTLADGARDLEEFDDGAGVWVMSTGRPLSLAPGGARLLRWTTP